MSSEVKYLQSQHKVSWWNLIDKDPSIALPAQECDCCTRISHLGLSCSHPPGELPALPELSARVPWPGVPGCSPWSIPRGIFGQAAFQQQQHKAAFSRKGSNTVWIDPGFDVREQWLDLDCKQSCSDPLDRTAQLLLAAWEVPVGTKLSHLMLKCFIISPLSCNSHVLLSSALSEVFR